VESREIGMYDSCLFGCSYCYATKSFTTADKNHSTHNPQSESLIGNYTAPPSKNKPEQDDQEQYELPGL
jgi:DNA repair photolyase